MCIPFNMLVLREKSVNHLQLCFARCDRFNILFLDAADLVYFILRLNHWNKKLKFKTYNNQIDH